MILSYHLLYSTLRIFVNKSFKSANAIYSGYFTQKCYYNFHFHLELDLFFQMMGVFGNKFLWLWLSCEINVFVANEGKLLTNCLETLKKVNKFFKRNYYQVFTLDPRWTQKIWFYMKKLKKTAAGCELTIIRSTKQHANHYTRISF